MNLNRLLVILLTGAYLILIFELRAEHQDVLGQEPVAWVPIIYSGLMIAICVVCAVLRRGVLRRVLFWSFAIGLIVGTVGFFEHNGDNLGQRLSFVGSVWTQAPATHSGPDANAGQPREGPPDPGGPSSQAPRERRPNALSAPLIPPVFAPLTFAGLSLMGMAVGMRSLQCGEDV